MNDTESPRWLTQTYWQGRFDVADTPWDLGHPSTVLLEAFDALAQLGTSVKGLRILSPGCGRGLDALALIGQGANVLAVDWSVTAVAECRRRYQEMSAQLDLSSHEGRLAIVAADLFAIPPTPLDCVAEHTFFCAIDPSARPRYVETMAAWLRSGGFLVGNFFILSDQEANALPALSLTREGEGPPFATTVDELESLLSPHFKRIVLRPSSQPEPERRPGMEWIGVFQRK